MAINVLEFGAQDFHCNKGGRQKTRAGEPANFFSAPAPAPAPAPDFFPNRLRLRLLVFFQAAPAPAPAPRSQKHPAPAPAPDYWLSLPKYSFPHKLVR